MDDNILDFAHKEKERLEAALANNADFQKLKAVEGIIASYGKAATKATRYVKQVDAAPRAGSKRQQVWEYAKQCIAENNGAASKQEIEAYLKERNIEMPAPHLASYLSQAPDLSFDGVTRKWVNGSSYDPLADLSAEELIG